MPSVDAIKEQQAWSRIITQQGDKLGLNPSARARLIKKKAEKKLDQFGDEFD
jgi:phage terminase small subunit